MNRDGELQRAAGERQSGQGRWGQCAAPCLSVVGRKMSVVRWSGGDAVGGQRWVRAAVSQRSRWEGRRASQSARDELKAWMSNTMVRDSCSSRGEAHRRFEDRGYSSGRAADRSCWHCFINGMWLFALRGCCPVCSKIKANISLNYNDCSCCWVTVVSLLAE